MNECSTSNTNFKYGGVDIDCVGVKTGDSLESVIDKLAEYVCNINPSNFNQVVFYTEEDLGVGSVAETPNAPSNITGTSYTIPSGGSGDYEIVYNCEVVVRGEVEVVFGVYVNGNLYSFERSITNVLYDNDFHVVRPISILLSNIALVTGDTIQIRGLTSDSTSFPKNAVCKITKLG